MIIKHADNSNFNEYSLDNFERYQKVTNVYRLENGELKIVYNPFIEDWSLDRRRVEAKTVMNEENITFCAFENDTVIGAITLTKALDDSRMIVDSFHVTTSFRRHGIGRALFETAKEEAARRGAKSLYISACSSEETINFYMEMGCRLSEKPIKSFVESEPYDLQLECDVM